MPIVAGGASSQAEVGKAQAGAVSLHAILRRLLSLRMWNVVDISGHIVGPSQIVEVVVSAAARLLVTDLRMLTIFIDGPTEWRQVSGGTVGTGHHT